MELSCLTAISQKSSSVSSELLALQNENKL